MLESLTIESFRPHVGSPFRIVVTETLTLDATLAEAQELAQQRPGAARAPFKLLFHAPLRPILPQRIYRLEHDALGVLDLFIVPIGPAGDRMQYEAIFT